MATPVTAEKTPASPPPPPAPAAGQGAAAPGSAAPAPAPAPSTPASAAEAASPKKKPKKDLLKPFRYCFDFIGGTISGGLDGMAGWGRKGMWFGVGVGLLVAMSGFGWGAILTGWAVGLAAGAVSGAAVGVATGGVKTVQREQRKVKYAEDLIARAEAKSKPQPRSDYRDAHREHYQRANYNFDRMQQQDRENRQDSSTYFQDHVTQSRSGGHYHGV